MLAHSSYSLRYGMIDPENWVSLALENGYSRLALTDINNTSGILSFIRYGIQHGLTPVAGIDFRNGIDCCYIGIARNNQGFLELNNWLSKHLHQEKYHFPEIAPAFDNAWVIYPWGKEPPELRFNEYIGIAPHQLTRFQYTPPSVIEKCVALPFMTFRNKQDFNTHRLLRAIDTNCLLSKLPEKEQSRSDELLRSLQQFRECYKETPFLPEQLETLLETCSIHFDFGEFATSQNIASYTQSKAGDLKLIRQLCQKGISKRYDAITTDITQRIEKEIEIISDKNYLSYFLVAWDLIRYAQSKGYFYVGRGSGANSIVAYLLEITDVDPLELDLYFERFINLYRKNPPDFDIDFSWRDRDDITRHLFERFPNAALLCTYNTFQSKATIRELGKVFGLPKSDIDDLCNESKTMITDQIQQLVIRYGKLIAGLPSHLSIHAGGIIIPEKPINWYTTTFLPPKGYPTTQFSMLEAEDVGLYKFDILSQRGLGKIKDTLEIIAYNQPDNPPRDIHDVKYFKTDVKINHMLSEAKALGCFYVESPAMRMLMTKLRTNSYLGLVAASSIIRPGVANSGMMRQYILRHRQPEKYMQDVNPILLEIMQETYGVMVYQEDVIKVAHHFGGLSLAESDILRRGMSGKFRSRDEFQQVREQFFINCRTKGYSDSEIQDVWRQIESFAGYAFSKGHSASYAVESYQSLYLKAYYPLEYMVATINNFGGFYRTEMYVHEARKLGARIEAPCINHGKYETFLAGNTIKLGFQHVNGIEARWISKLLDERENRGLFQSFDDLMNRINIPLEQLLLLIRTGSLRTIPENKKSLLWRAHLHHTGKPRKHLQATLFTTEIKHYELPVLEENQREEAFEQMELMDFPLCNPFTLIDEVLQPFVHARELHRYTNQTIRTYGYLVTVKRTTTVNQQAMLFGTLLDIDGEQLDTVHFPHSTAHFPFRGKGIYEIRGKVVEEFDFITIEVTYLRKIPFCNDPRYEEREIH